MKLRMLFLLFGFALLIIFNQEAHAQQRGTCCASDWKLPLQAGQWLITQGDKDSCVSSHCAPTWEVNEYALDIVSASEGTIRTLGAQVFAPADGKVIDTFWDGYGGGNVLKIEHGDSGPVSVYLHLGRYLAAKGDSVRQGTPVATIGNSGTSTGAHLHVVFFKSKTQKLGLKIVSWDGNTVFTTGSKIRSTNGNGETSPTSVPSLTWPSLSSPGNNSSWPHDTQVTLKWTSVSNASQYKVELWGGDYNLMTPCDWQSGTSCQIGTMYPGVMQWHVKARNANGESEWSETWKFTINPVANATQTSIPTAVSRPTNVPQSPPPPVLREPAANGQFAQTTDIWFSWRTSLGASQYYLEYWGGPYETLNSGWIGDTAYHIGTMWPGSYQWHVKARNSNGMESGWSDTWTFTINQPPTDVPVLPTDTPILPTYTPPPSFTGNIAPRAARIPDGIGSNNAFDGDLASFWTDGLGHAFTLELRLPDLLPINRILVWDRPQNSPDNSQINALIIRLSNGVEGRFDMQSQGARCIDVTLTSAQIVSSVTLKADGASGNNGLSEVEIWAGSKTSGPSCPNSGTMP